MKFEIKDYTDLGIEYRDSGPWRNYEVTDACGETLGEFLENITIAEIDQDGGELRCYGFTDASLEIQDRILKLMGANNG